MRFQYALKETIATIGADSMEMVEVAITAIKRHRAVLERYIREDPFFAVTLEPHEVPDSAPDIVRRMAEAGRTAGIGPMGAVAGTIASLAVEAMIDAGADYAFVDNGGDIALFSDRPVLVGIYAGSSRIKNIALDIPPTDFLLGICTSSGTVGPSISFGNADAALVVSRDVSLADAAATALGNAVRGEVLLESVFDEINKLNRIVGALVIKDDKMAVWGNLPRLVRIEVSPELITKG